MDIICPACGKVNPAQVQTCSVCGSPLPAAPRQPAAPLAPLKATVVMTGAIPAPAGSGAELLLPDGSTLPLGQLNTIGRDPNQCSLAFPDTDRLSRRHACIEQAGGDWIISDLGSTNGTYINGTRISGPSALRPGDQIGLGSFMLRFHIPGMALAPVAPVAPMAAQPNAFYQPFQQLAPTPLCPPGGWHPWQDPPLVEGYVRFISPRYTMKKNDLVKRGLMAAALAVLVTPALAFLPFIQGSDVGAQDFRLEDHINGNTVDVKMLGDVMGSINQGDPVAVWGMAQHGVIVMRVAYNYVTNSYVSVKK